MTTSEKRRLIIPANLGYGMRGAGGVIHGGMFDKFLLYTGATLVFDVEMLSVK